MLFNILCLVKSGMAAAIPAIQIMSPVNTMLVNLFLQVCFTCKEIKFSFFGPWGVKCKMCERTVCDKCSSKVIYTIFINYVKKIKLFYL